MTRSYRATLKETTASFSKRRNLQQRRQENEEDEEMELLTNDKNLSNATMHQFAFLEGVSQSNSFQAANASFRKAPGIIGQTQASRQQHCDITTRTPLEGSSSAPTRGTAALFPSKRTCSSDVPPSTPPSQKGFMVRGAISGGNATPTPRILISPPVPRRVTADANNPPSSADAASGANSFHHRYSQNASLPNHHFYHQAHHHQQQQGYYHSNSLPSAAISRRPPFYSKSPTTSGQEAHRQMSSHLNHHHGLVAANGFPSYLHHPPRPCCYPDAVTFANTRVEAVGDKSFKIYKIRLPPCLLPLLDMMVVHAEAYASTRAEGWRTDLYSLTKQDLAIMDIPGMAKLVEPIVYVIKSSMILLYGKNSNGSNATAKNTTVEIDKNQPHILKYSVDTGHTGVELHHDRCDVTANLVLSRSSAYRGGGTILPDAGQVVRLEHGEYLLHPGALVHGGKDVTSGTRYLMLMFAHLKSK